MSRLKEYRSGDIIRTELDQFDLIPIKGVQAVAGVGTTTSLGEYDNSTLYAKNKMVSHEGIVYVATQATVGNTPTTPSNFWQAYGKGINFKGDYDCNANTEYPDADPTRGDYYRCTDEGSLASPGVAEAFKAIVTGGNNSNLTGSFFQFQDGNGTNYFVWFNEDGLNPTPPVGSVGTGVEVSYIPGGLSNNDMAQAVVDAVDLLPAFDASRSTNEALIATNIVGTAVDAPGAGLSSLGGPLSVVGLTFERTAEGRAAFVSEFFRNMDFLLFNGTQWSRIVNYTFDGFKGTYDCNVNSDYPTPPFDGDYYICSDAGNLGTSGQIEITRIDISSWTNIADLEQGWFQLKDGGGADYFVWFNDQDQGVTATPPVGGVGTPIRVGFQESFGAVNGPFQLAAEIASQINTDAPSAFTASHSGTDEFMTIDNDVVGVADDAPGIGVSGIGGTLAAAGVDFTINQQGEANTLLAFVEGDWIYYFNAVWSKVTNERLYLATKVLYDNSGSTLTATEVKSALDELDTDKLAAALKGAASGVAELDAGSVVPTAQVPEITEVMLSSAVQSKLNNTLPNNLSGTAAPGVNNDINDSANASNSVGFEVGSIWIDTVGDNAYRATDVTDGAAVWVLTTLSTEDLGNLAFLNTVGTTEINNAAVTSDKLAGNAVTTAKIINDAVTAVKLAPSAVTTAKVLDNAITLLKMDDGTPGGVIGFDVAGNPVYVPPGNVGQVLTSGGAGLAPSFQDVSGGGGGDKVKVDAFDTTAGFLLDKLLEGSNISFQVVNVASNEILQISATDAGGEAANVADLVIINQAEFDAFFGGASYVSISQSDFIVEIHPNEYGYPSVGGGYELSNYVEITGKNLTIRTVNGAFIRYTVAAAGFITRNDTTFRISHKLYASGGILIPPDITYDDPNKPNFGNPVVLAAGNSVGIYSAEGNFAQENSLIEVNQIKQEFWGDAKNTNYLSASSPSNELGNMWKDTHVKYSFGGSDYLLFVDNNNVGGVAAHLGLVRWNPSTSHYDDVIFIDRKVTDTVHPGSSVPIFLGVANGKFVLVFPKASTGFYIHTETISADPFSTPGDGQLISTMPLITLSSLTAKNAWVLEDSHIHLFFVLGSTYEYYTIEYTGTGVDNNYSNFKLKYNLTAAAVTAINSNLTFHNSISGTSAVKLGDSYFHIVSFKQEGVSTPIRIGFIMYRRGVIRFEIFEGEDTLTLEEAHNAFPTNTSVEVVNGRAYCLYSYKPSVNISTDVTGAGDPTVLASWKEDGVVDQSLRITEAPFDSGDGIQIKYNSVDNTLMLLLWQYSGNDIFNNYAQEVVSGSDGYGNFMLFVSPMPDDGISFSFVWRNIRLPELFRIGHIVDFTATHIYFRQIEAETAFRTHVVKYVLEKQIGFEKPVPFALRHTGLIQSKQDVVMALNPPTGINLDVIIEAETDLQRKNYIKNYNFDVLTDWVTRSESGGVGGGGSATLEPIGYSPSWDSWTTFPNANSALVRVNTTDTPTPARKAWFMQAITDPDVVTLLAGNQVTMTRLARIWVAGFGTHEFLNTKMRIKTFNGQFQEDVLTPGGGIGIGDIFRIDLHGTRIEFTATDTLAATVVTNLVNLFNAETKFSAVTAINNTTFITLKADALFDPFEVTTSFVLVGGSGTTFSHTVGSIFTTEAQMAAGTNIVDDFEVTIALMNEFFREDKLTVTLTAGIKEIWAIPFYWDGNSLQDIDAAAERRLSVNTVFFEVGAGTLPNYVLGIGNSLKGNYKVKLRNTRANSGIAGFAKTGDHLLTPIIRSETNQLQQNINQVDNSDFEDINVKASKDNKNFRRCFNNSGEGKLDDEAFSGTGDFTT